MKRKVMDIFNNYGLVVRNILLPHTTHHTPHTTHHTQCRLFHTKKIGNKQLLLLFLSLLFFVLLFCLPTPAYAEETGIFDTDIDYRDILLPVLLLLVATLLVIIGGLVVRLRRERGKLLANREYLVRYIAYYLELKKQVPDVKEPYPFGPPEITPKEFIKVIDNMLRRIMYLSLFVLLALPLAAQDATAHEARQREQELLGVNHAGITLVWQLK